MLLRFTLKQHAFCGVVMLVSPKYRRSYSSDYSSRQQWRL